MNDNFELKAYLERKKKLIEDQLIKLNITNDSSLSAKAASYSLMAGGKRLRPVLCLAAEEICNSSQMLSMNCACAIEMIHTYSLIHDDLPAMDNDDLRRGKPTCHVKFGEAAAILAGDALLTKAFEILADQDLKPEITLETIKIISSASGDKGMISGQIKDIEAETKIVNISELEQIHMEKTGALIRASLKSGAVIAGSDEKGINHLDEYGKLIGLAFQVTDDILNVTGNPEVMGKAAGSDSDMNKATYPALIGLENSKNYARELIEKSVEHLKYFDQGTGPLNSLAWYILNRKK
ncbi:MAG: polyprenyl synthetase family protein [Thermodesulfobacteriota bacterium]